jgi:hypothetical protein
VERSCQFGIEPSDSIKCLATIEWPTTGGLSSSAQLQRVSFSSRSTHSLVGTCLHASSTG